MKKLFIVANWKSNLTSLEAGEWFSQVKSLEFKVQSDGKEIIICPPFTLLSELKSLISQGQLPVKLGAQNISPFHEGAYTGEVNGREIKEFADYVVIGHSERRQNFGENDEMLFRKVALAKDNGLAPIFCVGGKETKVPQGIEIVAYEPIDAIGTGHPDIPENAEDAATFFKDNHKVQFVLYGGSVTGDNVNSFTRMPHIDGVLVGKASLDIGEFLQIIKNA